VRKLRAAGVMRDSDRIVCVLTGHLLKDPEAIAKGDIVEVEPDIREVEKIIHH